jgi:processive 1,2-diacylglycerol beta-glucosyltransferase
MKKLFLFLLLFSSFLVAKKRVIIFSSKVGAAHKNATQVIKELLEPEFEVDEVNILSEVLYSLDPIMWVSNSYSEDFYNYIARSGWYWTSNRLADFGLRQFRNKFKVIVSLIESFLQQRRADLVISVMPIVNSQICEAAKNLNIPFIVNAIDFDLSYYFSDPVNYEKLKVLVPSINVINLKNFGSESVRYVGFPLRKSFFEQKYKKHIKSQFSIPQKPVVMIMMGGSGSKRIFYFVKNLVACTKPIHIIVCLGENKFLKRKIEYLKIPQNISISCIEFTDKISDLMAISDILITKSGPSSLIEAIKMELPVLIDGTTKYLNWEKYNAKMVQEYKLGEVIKNYGYTLKHVENILFNLGYKNQIKKNLRGLKLPDFNRNFKDIIKLIFT